MTTLDELNKQIHRFTYDNNKRPSVIIMSYDYYKSFNFDYYSIIFRVEMTYQGIPIFRSVDVTEKEKFYIY
jgi:phage terminase large subunit